MHATPVLEIGFATSTGEYFVLGSGTNGILGTNVLAAGRGLVPVWTDVSAWLRHFDYTRGRQRQTDTFPAGTMNLVLRNLDGRFSPTNLSGPYVTGGVTQIKPGIAVRLSVLFNSVKRVRFYGYVSSWLNPVDRDVPDFMMANVTVVDAFQQLARQVLPVGSPVGGGELSGARIYRILDAAGFDAGLRDIDTGLSTLQASDLSGNVLQSLQLVADSENGMIYMSESGVVTFRSRYARITRTASVTSQETFGDGGAAIGEDPYSAVVPAYDDTLVINTAQYTRVGGQTQIATDALSVDDYGAITDVKTGLLNQTDGEVASAAGWVVGRFSQPELRIDSVTIQPERLPGNLWTEVGFRTIDDRVTVKFRPSAGDMITQDLFIESIAETWDINDTWSTTYGTSNAAAFIPFFILGSSTQGVLGVNRLAY
jgi:hypothetical protein